MAQHDFNIDNQSAPAFRGDLNNALEALVTLSSNATAPATTYAGMIWHDTAANTLYIRSDADDAWIALGTLDQSANTFAPAGVAELTQVQAEDDTSTVFGQVSGQRLGQAVAANGFASRVELARTTVGVAVASVTFSAFDHATYNHYEFMFRDLVSSSTTQSKNWDISLNGITTTAAYDNSTFGSLGGESDSIANTHAFSQYSFTNIYNGDLKLFMSGTASYPTIGFGTQLAAYQSSARLSTWGFTRNANEVATSITFAFSLGNITAGDIVMYGVK